MTSSESEPPRAAEPTVVPGPDPLPIILAPDLLPLLEASDDAEVRADPSAGPCYRLRADGDDVTFSSPEGVELERWRADAPELAFSVAAALRAERRHRRLLELGRASGALPVEARFVEVPPERLGPYQARGYVAASLAAGAPNESSQDTSVRPAHRDFRATGGPLSAKLLTALEVTNPGTEPLYVTVLSLAADRSQNLIHPPGGRATEALEPGASQHVFVQIVLEDSWTAAASMRDRYVVFGTRSPVDLDGFLFPRRSTRPAEVPVAIKSAVEGGTADTGEPDSSFGIAVVDLFVERP